MNRRTLILVGLALALGVPAGLVVQKEYVLRAGAQVFLALAPVDPRSLIEGDYMRLSYAVSNEVREDEGVSGPVDGALVLALDDRRCAHFVRFDDGRPVGEGEVRIRYRRRHGFVRIGSDAFYFQEGEGDRYVTAKYGEVRLTGSGEAVLVGLRDADLKPLGEVPGRPPP